MTKHPVASFVRLVAYGLAGFVLGGWIVVANAQTASWTCGVTSASSFLDVVGGSGGSKSDACGAISFRLPLMCSGVELSRNGAGQISSGGDCVGIQTNRVECPALGLDIPAGSGLASVSCSVSYTCPPGQTYSSGSCNQSSVNGCNTTQTVTGFVPYVNGKPSSGAQFGGCNYAAVSASPCIENGTGRIGLCGTFQGSGEDADSGPVVVPSGGSTPNAPAGATPTSSGTTSGEGGGGTATGGNFNSADAANLSKTATNTATTVAAIDRLRAERAADASASLVTQQGIASTLATIAANTAGGSGPGGTPFSDAALLSKLDEIKGKFNVSLGGGFTDCTATPTCSGDALQCALATNARTTACALSAGPSSASYGASGALTSLEEVASTTPGGWFAINKQTVDLPTIYNRPRWMTDTGCPVVPPFAVLGHTFNVALTPLCDYKDLVAMILIITASMVGYRILATG